ncbi:MAG TPA: metallophosphoesterase [Prolixibacteraceae bacterium]|nr:metallophosphoesterase [Prolixibacteraceae bacterium]
MRHSIRHRILTLWLCILLTSCDLIEFHPYDIRKDSGEHNLNRSNIVRIEAADDNKDTIRFVFVTDTQRFYDETNAFVKDVNQRENIDFVIHGGDITDFGLSKEYLWIHDIMKKLKVPYVAVIGNHDIVGHGREVYKNIYGDLNFSFKFRGTRFVCLNTNALEFDYSTPVPDFDFMSGIAEDTINIKRTVVVMHSPPFDVQFNNNSVRTFNNMIEEYPQPLFCLNGHLHRLDEKDYFNNGITYIAGDDVSGRNYLLFTIAGNSYTYSVVYF